MVDFWEVFGRMVTNDDFRGQLYKTFPAKYYCLGVEVPSLGNQGLDIPPDDYNTARKLVANVITDGPVSLATLGELLMIISSQHFRDLADALAKKMQACVNTSNGSKLFYTAIGCMALDGQAVYYFANRAFDKIQFGNLTGLEQDAIHRLALNVDVIKAAVRACAEFWSIACDDDLLYYGVGNLKNGLLPISSTHHMHPIVQLYPPVPLSEEEIEAVIDQRLQALQGLE